LAGLRSHRTAATVLAVLVVLGSGLAAVIWQSRTPGSDRGTQMRDDGRTAATPTTAATPAPAVSPPTAQLPWTSGVWAGGEWGANRVAQFASWRGTQVQTVTTYPAYDTWEQLASSEWHVSIFDGFKGRLVYGLPLLPKSGGSLAEVATGRRDDVWRAIARQLATNERHDSYVRVGLEANGDWFPWGSDADEAPEFRAAFRHVVQVMRSEAPRLRFVFDISCGVEFKGSDGRLDSLTKLYPGDDVVDVIGCDAYDSYSTQIRKAGDFAEVARPDDAAGLLDVVDFARSHGKTFAVPEWGLTKRSADGAGDNPVFIRAMRDFFAAHAGELEFENYFNEPSSYLRSSIFAPNQNPEAAKVYQQLWGAAAAR
jgi:hypothetical protein